MNAITVEILAKKAGIAVDDLLKKISEAGLPMSSKNDTLDLDQQQKVLTHIRSTKKKIGLKLKPISLKAKIQKTDEITKEPAPELHKRNLDQKTSVQKTNTQTQHQRDKIAKQPREPSTPAPKPLSVEEVLATRTKSSKKSVNQRTEPSAPLKPESASSDAVKPVLLNDSMSVEELAGKIGKSTTDVIKLFFDLGEMVTINQIIPFDLAELICEHTGFQAKLQPKRSEEEALMTFTDEDQEEDIQPRSAIVTIMGHVDHGKTTLLDTIRKTKVVDKEAGGITQHIGAYKVHTDHGDITFLDTPGHESFTAMRARGAGITDIVVLVVAANDGVMPQTIEAIQHAKAAEVPIIVAINKIDNEAADVDRMKTDLSQHGLSSEDWGGDTIFQKISAKTGQGIDDLLDSIALQAEVLELKANFSGRAKGTIIESRVDLGLGPIATILVESGKFTTGSVVLVNEHYGKIRVMYDHMRKKKTSAGPSDTIEITGLSGLPNAGDRAIGLQNEKEARLIASRRRTDNRLQARLHSQQTKDDVFLKQMDDKVAQQKELSVIIKSDVHGSLEAILDIINKINDNPETKELIIKVVAHTVGGINSSDIHLAIASRALIIAFNVRADASAKKLQAQEKTKIEYFSTVYDIHDYLLQLSKDIVTPETSEKIIGSSDVKEVFRASKQLTIAGCIVSDGVIKKNANVRLLRDQKAIYTGKILSLRRFQDDIAEVKHGLECGIGIKGYTDVKPGDVIEAFIIEKNTN